jgi:hypothetical protein
MPERTEKREASAQIPVVVWVSIEIVVAAAAIMLVAKSTQPTWVEAFAVGVFASVTFAGTVGAFWMTWAALRHDHPIPKLVVAGLVPFAFVWYYFKRASLIEREYLTRSLRSSLSAVAGVMIFVFVVQRIFPN